VMAFLLPYIEQGPLWNQMVNAVGSSYFSTETVSFYWSPAVVPTSPLGPMAQAQIPVYQCPSDSNGPSASASFGRIHFTSGGASGGTSTPPAPLTGRWGWTSYVGVAGYLGTGSATAPGIFTDRSKLKLTAITDGTSNTLMFGETLGDVAGSLNFTWMGAGVLATAWGTPADPNTASWVQFASFHPGIVQFCFADGSVRPVLLGLTTNPDFSTYVYLSGYNDGRVRDFAAVTY